MKTDEQKLFELESELLAYETLKVMNVRSKMSVQEVQDAINSTKQKIRQINNKINGVA